VHSTVETLTERLGGGRGQASEKKQAGAAALGPVKGHASTTASCGCGSELKAEQERESGSGPSTFTGRSAGERNPVRLKRGDETGGSHPLTYLCGPRTRAGIQFRLPWFLGWANPQYGRAIEQISGCRVCHHHVSDVLVEVILAARWRYASFVSLLLRTGSLQLGRMKWHV
jgi:hypothetical protein